MAKWQRHLRLGDIYHAGLPIPELAVKVAKRVRAITIPETDAIKAEHLAEERDEIAYNLEDLAKDETASADDFDYIMSDLYDWADTPLESGWNGKKLCWVETTKVNDQAPRLI